MSTRVPPSLHQPLARLSLLAPPKPSLLGRPKPSLLAPPKLDRPVPKPLTAPPKPPAGKLGLSGDVFTPGPSTNKPAAPSATPAKLMPQAPFGVGDIMRKTDLLERAGVIPPGQSAKIGLYLGNAPVDERKMYAQTLGELDLLKQGSITPAQYFTRVQEHAAQLSNGDGKAFVRLVGMAFSEAPWDPTKDLMRTAMGGGAHPAFGLESAYSDLVNNQLGGTTTGSGFNASVVDTDKSSTITHHFGELLQVGANRTQLVGSMAQDLLDGPENPGDAHNGNFAAMLGQALENGQITPDQAVKLTTFAYTSPFANSQFPKVTQGPWNSTNMPNNASTNVSNLATTAFTSPQEFARALETTKGYQLADWLGAMKNSPA